MPPKVRFTREKIEETAYLMAKERGLDAVAAREVAKAMHMTVTPIFTYFSGMEELKRTVRDRVRREFREYLQESAEYTPAFLEFCMRWIRYAAENPNLYELLMHTGGGICQMDELLELFPEIVEPIEKEISDLFVLSSEEAHTLLRHMMIYAHGVADFYLCGGSPIPEEKIPAAMSEICLALAARIKILNGTADMDTAKTMLSYDGLEPKKN